jgi:hypothetical protein
VHFQVLGPFEDPVVNRAVVWVEDQVDQHAIVVRLEQPAFGRPLDAHSGLAQRLLRALRVLGLDQEVHVVLGLRPAARPRGQSAAEDEGNARFVQHAAGALHGVEEVLEVSC